MAAPEHVPSLGADRARYYSSPPRLNEPWLGGRPGELDVGQPSGPAMGVQGPDQGYALRLARRFRDRLLLTASENADDVMAGTVQIAMKRASLFGRAPTGSDLELALTVFGYLRSDPPADLVATRHELFAGVSHGHHYMEMRRIVASVPESTLRSTPAAVAADHGQDWRALLHLETAGS